LFCAALSQWLSGTWTCCHSYWDWVHIHHDWVHYLVRWRKTDVLLLLWVVQRSRTQSRKWSGRWPV